MIVMLNLSNRSFMYNTFVTTWKEVLINEVH